MKTKRVLISCLLITCMLVLTVMPASAAIKEPDASINAQFYTSASATLSIASDGTATATGRVNGINGVTTRVSMYVYVQQYQGGDWVNIADWSLAEDEVNVSLTESVKVPAGYDYRVRVSGFAYSGTRSESILEYSVERHY